MLHKTGDRVAFVMNASILVGVVKHSDEDQRSHYVKVEEGTICCDHFVEDWALMTVQEKQR